jgi:glutamate 5-kinase
LSPFSIGGMVTKLQAARKAALFGVPMILANGTVEGTLKEILSGEEVGTLFTSEVNKLRSRKHWIAFTLQPLGKIIVDDGARKAILKKGKSLLPSGILAAEGKFSRGDPVTLMDMQREEFAKGLVNYSSAEITKIKGLKSQDVEIRLGYKYRDEVIHRDDLVCHLSQSESCAIDNENTDPT